MSENTENRLRLGRPKKDPESCLKSIAIALTPKYIDEIKHDMEAHGQEVFAEKIREIIDYWLVYCPDRVEKEIPRKKRRPGGYNLGR